jgi:hypothetical protein
VQNNLFDAILKICIYTHFFVANGPLFPHIRRLTRLPAQRCGSAGLDFGFLIYGGFCNMAKQKEVLVVASKVRAYIKSKKMMTSSEAIGAISDKVYCMLDHAAERTKANRRSTIKPQDL